MQRTHTAFWTGRVPASGAVAAGLYKVDGGKIVEVAAAVTPKK